MRHFFRGVVLVAALALTASCAGEGFPSVTPAPTSAPLNERTSEDAASSAMDAMMEPTPVSSSGADSESNDAAGVRVQASLLSQNRIIVHTATLSLVIENVARAVDGVTMVADRFGGWVVSSQRQSRHSGAISIRVPAQSLDVAIREIEALALETEANQISSQDVTEEFVDSQSRLESLRATEQRLLSFLDQAVDVEEALKVESELGALQLRIEEIQGRLNYLSEVAAYSLINVNLRLTPAILDVDPGEDAAYRVGQTARFQATFVAPQDVDDFSFAWDFGDGTTATGRGSALRPDGRRVTASVSHTYGAEGDYVASVTLTGTGDGGIAEGANSLLVSVSEVPTIEVFAGDDRTVEENAELEYAASFTRPVELRDYEYRWDFGDGSPTVDRQPGSGGHTPGRGARIRQPSTHAVHRPGDRQRRERGRQGIGQRLVHRAGRGSGAVRVQRMGDLGDAQVRRPCADGTGAGLAHRADMGWGVQPVLADRRRSRLPGQSQATADNGVHAGPPLRPAGGAEYRRAGR